MNFASSSKNISTVTKNKQLLKKKTKQLSFRESINTGEINNENNEEENNGDDNDEISESDNNEISDSNINNNNILNNSDRLKNRKKRKVSTLLKTSRGKKSKSAMSTTVPSLRSSFV